MLHTWTSQVRLFIPLPFLVEREKRKAIQNLLSLHLGKIHIKATSPHHIFFLLCSAVLTSPKTFHLPSLLGVYSRMCPAWKSTKGINPTVTTYAKIFMVSSWVLLKIDVVFVFNKCITQYMNFPPIPVPNGKEMAQMALSWISVLGLLLLSYRFVNCISQPQ